MNAYKLYLLAIRSVAVRLMRAWNAVDAVGDPSNVAPLTRIESDDRFVPVDPVDEHAATAMAVLTPDDFELPSEAEQACLDRNTYRFTPQQRIALDYLFENVFSDDEWAAGADFERQLMDGAE